MFRDRDGSPILPRGFSGAFSKIMHRAGLEDYRLHDTRHAHGTLILSQGVHPKIVAERLGHSRVGVTLDTYCHVIPGLQEAAALRFEGGWRLAKHRSRSKRHFWANWRKNWRSPGNERPPEAPGGLISYMRSGGDEGTRTLDPLHAMQVLSQLSYIPTNPYLERAGDWNGLGAQPKESR